MIVIDAQTLIAVAAVIGSLSSLIWSIRRSPHAGAVREDRANGLDRGKIVQQRLGD
jgi:hypothetical protein